jgi:hypothetical protein
LNVQSSNNLRNYGISEYQSSSTLQNSVCKYTIQKSPRFKNSSDNHHGLYIVPSDLGTGRKAGFGFGTRQFPKENKMARNSPSPSHYKLQSFVDKVLKNSGLKIGERLPDKVYYYNVKKAFNNPGPGMYDVKTPNNLHRAASLTFRKGMYYDEGMKEKNSVSPQKYNPNTKPIENGRFSKVGIGIGEKRWNLIGKNPGVGEYDIPSSFDKSRKLKMPIN